MLLPFTLCEQLDVDILAVR